MSTTMILAGAAGGAAAALTPTVLLLRGAYTRIRELRSSLSAARYAATHDGLTSLLNREGFHAAAGPAVATKWAGQRLVMLVDLDGFKLVNDACGHGVGDLVLHAVARRLREVCGPSAVVGRLGGDEFAILLPLFAGEKPQEAAQLVRTLVGAERVNIDGVVLRVTLSIGVALVDAPADLAVLLGMADAAMYRAKHGDVGVAVYDQRLDDHSAPMAGVRPEVRVRDLEPELALAGAAGPVRTVQ